MRRFRQEKACAHCGKVFVGGPREHFCSGACARAFREIQEMTKRQSRVEAARRRRQNLQRRIQSRSTVSRLKEGRIRAGNAACDVCGWKPPEPVIARGGHLILTAHHVVPLACGGSNREENLVVLCPNHHAIAHRLGFKRSQQWYGPTSRDDLIGELVLLETDPEKWTKLRLRRMARIQEGSLAKPRDADRSPSSR